MAIAADPFAPPKAIGQGLTPIAEPNYAPSSGGEQTSSGAESAAAGPFGAGGALSTQADDTRAGLAKLLGGGGANPSLDMASGALPINEIGMPTLGGSSVSTKGAAATQSPSSDGGLARLLGGENGGGSSTGLGAYGGPVAASEGGRAFGPDSPFSGFSGTGINLALGIGSSLLGLGIPLGLTAPLTMARGVEGIANGIGFPTNFTATTPEGETLEGQSSNTGFFGFGQGTRGNSPTLSDSARGVDADAPTGVDAGPTTGEASGTGAPGAGAGDSGDAGAPGDYARGGPVPNRNPGPGDDEPAMLTGGEFVLKPAAVKRLGLARLMRQNRAS